jgi:sugar phosphate isomerase/epimerase
MPSSNRRHFLKATMTGAAGLAASPLLGAEAPGTSAATAQAGPRLNAADANRISILSYSFLGLYRAGQLDIFGYLESCRHRYGLDAANIWNGMLPSTDEAYLKKVREALDERNLKLCVLTTDGTHVWDPDPAVRAKNRAAALAQLNAARILGAEFLRLDAGGPAAGDRTSIATKEWSNEAFDGIVAGYREYATYAADHGFKMGPENHTGPEGIWSNMQKLYKAVAPHPGFGLSVHMSQWQGTRAEKDLADRESAPWVVAAHFDNNTCNGPLEEKMRLLRDAGYKGWYVVENHSNGQNEYALTGLQVAQVRAVLQSWRDGSGQSRGVGSGTL